MADFETLKNSKSIELLSRVEGEYVSNPHDSWLCGVGGVFYFKFKVKNIAANDLPKLVFEYKRVWEKGVPPYGKAEITLKK